MGNHWEERLAKESENRMRKAGGPWVLLLLIECSIEVQSVVPEESSCPRILNPDYSTDRSRLFFYFKWQHCESTPRKKMEDAKSPWH